MIPLAQLPGAPFDLVFDVGGNVGEFAERAYAAWPEAIVVSFEPLPGAARANRERAAGRWQVVECAISEHPDTVPLRFCLNQHSASTMQAPGTARREHFGIADRFETIMVETLPLDRWSELVRSDPRTLVKVDVEGHEAHVLRGARHVLAQALTVVCEVQQDATIFLGSPSPLWIEGELCRRGLSFAGLADVFCSPAGDVLQFDGIWTRAGAPLYHYR